MKILYLCLLTSLISISLHAQIAFDTIEVKEYSCDNNGYKKGQVTLKTTDNTGVENAFLYKDNELIQTKKITSNTLVFDSLIFAPAYQYNYTIEIENEGIHTITYPTWSAQRIITISVSPSTTICANTQINLIAQGTASMYVWNDGQQSSQISKNPNETATYSVTGTYSDGCKYTASKTITVNNPVFTITANPPTINSGQSTQLTVSGGNNYNWSDGLGNNASVTVAPTQSRMYNVSGYDSNNCPGKGFITIIVDGKPFTPITSIYLPDTIVEKGKQFTMNPVIQPEDATNKTLVWNSGNGGIANVSTTGVINPNMVGTTIIQAQSSDGSNKTYSCNLTVVQSIIHVDSIHIQEMSVILPKGSVFNSTLAYYPNNATYKQVVWHSLNTNIAKVSSTGNITGENIGTTYIYASYIKNI